MSRRRSNKGVPAGAPAAPPPSAALATEAAPVAAEGEVADVAVDDGGSLEAAEPLELGDQPDDIDDALDEEDDGDPEAVALAVQEPEDTHATWRGPPPLHEGQELRCEEFETGAAVTGVVKQLSPNGAEALLWIESLARDWPILAERTHDGAWDHVISDYPAPGDSPSFDERFRPPAPSAAMPRRARAGYVWVRMVGTVSGNGFGEDGHPRSLWRDGEIAEFPRRVVKDSPSAFTVIR